MVKNLPVNAGDTGSIPGPEDPTGHGATKPVCPTEPALRSSRAETTEAPTAWSPRPEREATAIRSRKTGEQPLLTTTGGKPTQLQRPSTAKNK